MFYFAICLTWLELPICGEDCWSSSAVTLQGDAVPQGLTHVVFEHCSMSKLKSMKNLGCLLAESQASPRC